MYAADRQPGGSEDGSAAVDEQQAPPPVTSPFSRRTIVVLVLAALASLGAVVLALEVFVAERIPELTPERLAEAQELWAQNGPASYIMDLQIGGQRPGPVHVEVRSGEVVAMTRDGRSPDQPRTWQAWAVQEQFETLRRELEMAADPVHELGAQPGAKVWLRCDFDAQTGYPRRFQRMVSGGGPEHDLFWQVTKFAVQ